MSQNPMCDGNHCDADTGEVRLLPIGKMSNAIVCRGCYQHEITWRNTENLRLAEEFKFNIPAWKSLKIYATEPQK